MSPISRRTLITGAGVAIGAGMLSRAQTAQARPGRGALIGEANRTQLHVMSFNIRYDRSNVTKPGEPDHWPDRAPILTELLKAEQPTLLGIQESLYGQLSTIEAALPKHRLIGYRRQGGSHDEYSGIYYDAERISVTEWDQFWLSDTPKLIGSATWGNTVTRIVTWARLRDLTRDIDFFLINTHFDHQSEPARVNSAHAIVDLIGGLPEQLPIIVTGDFNSSSLGSGAYATLVGSGALEDTWVTAEKRLTPAWNTFAAYKELVEGNSRIDWVLTSSDVRVRQAAINPFRVDGRYPSDHLPVQALVQLPLPE